MRSRSSKISSPHIAAKKPARPERGGQPPFLSNELRIHHLPLRGTQRSRDDDMRSLQSIRLHHRRQRSRPLRGSPHPHRNSPGDGNPHPRHRSPTRQRKSLTFMILNRIEYQRARKARGTQTQIADALGIRRVTIMRRETARSAVTREAMLALLTLPVLSVDKCPKKLSQKSDSLTDEDCATAPAPRRSKDAGNGSAAGATTLSKARSTSVAQLKITRGKAGAITSTASAD